MASPMRVIREEFRVENFSPCFPDPTGCARCQWLPLVQTTTIISNSSSSNLTNHLEPHHFKSEIHQSSSSPSSNSPCCNDVIAYPVYRLVVAVLFATWSLADLFDECSHFYEGNCGTYFEFATNWNFVFAALAVIYQAVLAVLYALAIVNHKNDTYNSKYGYSVFYVLYNAAMGSALAVTILYWGYMIIFNDSEIFHTPMSFTKHSLNSIYALADLMISATPIRLLHAVYGLSLGLLYTIFNAIYFVGFNGEGPNGKPYVYIVMDWSYPAWSILTCFLGFFMLVLAQCILFAWYRLRLYLYSRVCQWRGLKDAKRNNSFVIIPLDFGTFKAAQTVATPQTLSPNLNEYPMIVESDFYQSRDDVRETEDLISR